MYSSLCQMRLVSWVSIITESIFTEILFHQISIWTLYFVSRFLVTVFKMAAESCESRVQLLVTPKSSSQFIRTRTCTHVQLCLPLCTVTARAFTATLSYLEMTPRRIALSPKTFCSKSRTLAFPARPKPTTTIPKGLTSAIADNRKKFFKILT